MNLKFKNGSRLLNLDKGTLLMGIVNRTPDSFSDGGVLYKDLQKALNFSLDLINDGADIIDIGGESTRPDAESVNLDEELERTIPLIEALRKESGILISIDTTKSEVARQAIIAGADIVNDVSGFHLDDKMLPLIKEFDCLGIAMHRKGTPKTMQNPDNLSYDNIVEEINRYFAEILLKAQSLGIASKHIILDPGLGFSKNFEQNITIIKSLKEFYIHQSPLLIGPSRKSFLGAILDEPHPQNRLWATMAVLAYAINQNCHIVRVHDIKELHQVRLVLNCFSSQDF